jgi:hypothetical protein
VPSGRWTASRHDRVRALDADPHLDRARIARDLDAAHPHAAGVAVQPPGERGERHAAEVRPPAGEPREHIGADAEQLHLRERGQRLRARPDHGRAARVGRAGDRGERAHVTGGPVRGLVALAALQRPRVPEREGGRGGRDRDDGDRGGGPRRARASATSVR